MVSLDYKRHRSKWPWRFLLTGVVRVFSSALIHIEVHTELGLGGAGQLIK